MLLNIWGLVFIVQVLALFHVEQNLKKELKGWVYNVMLLTHVVIFVLAVLIKALS